MRMSCFPMCRCGEMSVSLIIISIQRRGFWAVLLSVGRCPVLPLDKMVRLGVLILRLSFGNSRLLIVLARIRKYTHFIRARLIQRVGEVPSTAILLCGIGILAASRTD